MECIQRFETIFNLAPETNYDGFHHKDNPGKLEKSNNRNRIGNKTY